MDIDKNALIEQYQQLSESLNGRQPTVPQRLELARAARAAGMPKETRHHVEMAGELAPRDPMVLSALKEELSPEEMGHWEERHREEVPFWKDLKRIVAFPASRDALFMLGTASVCLSLYGMVSRLAEGAPPMSRALSLPLQAVSGLAGILVLALLPGLHLDIVQRAAHGREGFPGWPDLRDIVGDLLAPALKAALVAAWSFFPLLLFLTTSLKAGRTPSPLVSLVLTLIGCAYYPPALLLLAVSGKLWPALLPSNVIDGIVKSRASFFRMLPLFWAMTVPALLLVAIAWSVPVIGSLAVMFAWLYGWACSLHLLGRFYRLEEKNLGWT